MTIGVPNAVLQDAEHARLTLPQAATAPEKSRAAETGHVAAAGGGEAATTGGGEAAGLPQVERAARTDGGTPALMIEPA